MEKVDSPQQIMLGRLNIHMQKNEVDTYTQINSKCIKDKYEFKPIKLIEENREKSSWYWSWQWFFEYDTRTTGNKSKAR